MSGCVERQLVRLFLIAFAWLFAVPAAAQVTLIGSYTWENNDPLFGGFSAIEVRDNGNSFIALSDRGSFAQGQFERSGGRITSVTLGGLSPLLGPNGNRLPREFSDSEGIAVDQDGAIYVSFEWQHGLRRFARVDAPAGPLLTTDAFDDLQTNSSLEALAIDAHGTLYAIPERSGIATRPYPVFRLKDGIWDQPFNIPRTGPYLVAGADIGPDGRLYILERDFVGIGFRTRVRRFDLEGEQGETLVETSILTHDNLEGISVWRDAMGLRMTLISDDNFRRFQRTEIVEFRLTQ